MSAIRTSRRSSRPPQSPYSRPPTKKSSWSITGFLKSLVPWSSAETDAEDDTAMQEDVPAASNSPAVSLSVRGHQLERETNEKGQSSQSMLSPTPRFPLSPAKSTLFDPASPERDLETVSAHIRESLDRKDVEKLCVMLQGGSPPEEVSQPFRFSATPATPARGNSPFRTNNHGLGSAFSVSSSAPAHKPSPRKLNRNPNGVYRWQGGGSAKTPRSRNRYSSPAFGPSRSTSDRFVLKETVEVPRTDTKRRKVAEDVNLSSTSGDSSSTLLDNTESKPPIRAAAPDPSPTRIKQALPFPVSAGSPVTSRTTNSTTSTSASSQSTSRLRVPIVQKPSAPVVPSPLRQAWSDASSPSKSDPTTPSPKQTKAANYMTELIKEITPPKRPDLSNPYQTASPLGKVASAPKGRVGRRVRATGKPTMPVHKDERSMENGSKATDQEISPQAIIEATLPKGSKRSRPPAHFQKAPDSLGETISKQPLQAGSSSDRKRYTPYVEEEIDEEDADAKRTVKRSKSQLVGCGVSTVIDRSKSDSPEIVVEEVEVVDASVVPEKPQSVTSPPLASSSTSTTRAGLSAFPTSKSTSAPKEPSKLRYSYQPEATNSPAPEATAPTDAPASASTSPFSIPASTSRSASFFPSSTSASTPVASMPSSTLQSVSLSLPSRVSKSSVVPSPSPFFPASATPQVFATPRSDSPAVAFKPGQQAALDLPTSSLPSFTFSVQVRVPNTDSAHVKAVTEAKLIPISSLPSFDFSKGTAPSIMSLSTSAKSSSSAPPTSTPIVPFNWAGAGAKPPSPSNGATWTCLLCMLTNPMSATEQCEHCETKRPGSNTAAFVTSTSVATKAPAPVVQQFNWAAAGIKPPTVGDSWTCSLCGLSNPSSVTDKCNTCDNPRG